ncbi:hypothetical protein RB213_007154 [Colletotrichum asianum]
MPLPMLCSPASANMHLGT